MHEFGRAVVAVVVASGLLTVAGIGSAWAQGAWMASADAKGMKNPVNGVGNAVKVVEVNCASCHGAKGKGDGPAAAALNPKPADWTSDAVQKQTDGERFWKITNGRGAMPPWRQISEKERWEVVNHIRTLRR